MLTSQSARNRIIKFKFVLVGILLMRVCALYHRENVIRRLAIGICLVSWLVAATIVGRVDVTGQKKVLLHDVLLPLIGSLF